MSEEAWVASWSTVPPSPCSSFPSFSVFLFSSCCVSCASFSSQGLRLAGCWRGMHAFRMFLLQKLYHVVDRMCGPKHHRPVIKSQEDSPGLFPCTWWVVLYPELEIVLPSGGPPNLCCSSCCTQWSCLPTAVFEIRWSVWACGGNVPDVHVRKLISYLLSRDLIFSESTICLGTRCRI